MQTKRLVFDIETASKDHSEFDPYSKELLEKIYGNKENQEEEDISEGKRYRFAFSPLTAEIVAISTVDADSMKGGVYFQAKDKNFSFEEKGIKFESGDERFLLKKFWELAAFYDEFITFSGRTFDVPMLMIRSAVLGIRPSKNLMTNRYLGFQPSNARHIDLKDQFTFYGAKKERLGLHFWCQAFGISSPKIGEVKGEDITDLFKAGEYEKIARYCLADVLATRLLFQKWEEFLRFD